MTILTVDRLRAEARESLEAALRLLDRADKGHANVVHAATQAQQAATTLRLLQGHLEALHEVRAELERQRLERVQALQETFIRSMPPRKLDDPHFG